MNTAIQEVATDVEGRLAMVLWDAMRATDEDGRRNPDRTLEEYLRQVARELIGRGLTLPTPTHIEAQLSAFKIASAERELEHAYTAVADVRRRLRDLEWQSLMAGPR